MRISAWSSDVCSSDLPAVIADSTFLTKVRIRLTRDLLTSARRSFRRMRFLAWGVFAIGKPSNFLCLSVVDGRNIGCGHGLPRVRKARSLPSDGRAVNRLRSAEHTSELQSLMRISYAV